MTPRRACDICHRIKEKCRFTSLKDPTSCERCSRLGHECTTRRKELRLGRPPRSKSKRHALSSRLTEEVEPDTEEPDEEVATYCTDDAVTISASPITTQSLSLPLTDWDPVRTIFRTAVKADETRLMEFLFDKNGFVKLYCFGATFKSTMQTVIVTQFLHTPNIVTVGYLGMAGSIANSRGLTLGRHDDGTNLKNAGHALKKLQGLTISSQTDVAAVLNVGLALITFNQNRIGQSTLRIAQRSLRLVQPWYTDPRSEAWVEMDPNLLCTLFLEVFECLSHRKVPTFRYRVPMQDRIDRYFGICRSLLPVLYDICVFSHQNYDSQRNRSWRPHEASHDSESAAREERDEAIAQLLTKVDEFQPPHPTQVEPYPASESEIAYMLLQVWCYQATARLIIHQLSPPTSAGRHRKRAIARSILRRLKEIDQFDLCGSRYILFAYFVALTEIDCDDPERTDQPILERMMEYTSDVAQASCHAMHAFLEFVWAIRDYNPQASWLDLVACGPDFSVGL